MLMRVHSHPSVKIQMPIASTAVSVPTQGSSQLASVVQINDHDLDLPGYLAHKIIYSEYMRSQSSGIITRTPRAARQRITITIHCTCPAAAGPALPVACSSCGETRRTTSDRHARPSATAAWRCDAVASAALALSSASPRSMSASCAARNGRR